MSLLDLLQQSKPSTPVDVHPELRRKMLFEIKSRLQNELEPRIWRLFLGDDPNNEFPSSCFSIIDEIIENNLPTIPDNVAAELSNELFDESQTFWGEISEELKSSFIFLDKIVEKSRSEVEELFPQSEKIFGETATQLLIDLSFQYNIYSHKISAKKNQVDVRRMINIVGQIIEDIFSKNVFGKSMTLGEILKELERLKTNDGRHDREILLKKMPTGKSLLDKYFVEKLKSTNKLRGKYSHGATEATNNFEDFQICITYMLETRFGILHILYASLDT